MLAACGALIGAIKQDKSGRSLERGFKCLEHLKQMCPQVLATRRYQLTFYQLVAELSWGSLSPDAMTVAYFKVPGSPSFGGRQ